MRSPLVGLFAVLICLVLVIIVLEIAGIAYTLKNAR